MRNAAAAEAVLLVLVCAASDSQCGPLGSHGARDPCLHTGRSPAAAWTWTLLAKVRTGPAPPRGRVADALAPPPPRGPRAAPRRRGMRFTLPAGVAFPPWEAAGNSLSAPARPPRSRPSGLGLRCARRPACLRECLAGEGRRESGARPLPGLERASRGMAAGPGDGHPHRGPSQLPVLRLERRGAARLCGRGLAGRLSAL